MNCWIIKCTEDQGWHWNEYFSSRGSGPYGFGGADRIKDGRVRQRIRELMVPGDVAVCYQKEGREIHGLTLILRGGYPDAQEPDVVACFDLVPSGRALRFVRAISVQELRARGCDPEGFKMPLGRGAVIPMTAHEFAGFVKVIQGAQAVDSKRLYGWLTKNAIQHRPLRAKRISGGEQTQYGLDQRLSELEARYATKSDTYVAKQVATIIRRDGPLVRALKARYENRCQWPDCDAHIPMRKGGCYSEVAHVRPVSRGGNAKRVNLLVLCPNHHKMLDLGEVIVVGNTPRRLILDVNGEPVVIERQAIPPR